MTKGVSDGSPLVLYVTAADKANGIVVTALNGPLDEQGVTYVPTIPAGTGMHIMAPAMSESEVEIAPDAAYPKKRQPIFRRKSAPLPGQSFSSVSTKSEMERPGPERLDSE